MVCGGCVGASVCDEYAGVVDGDADGGDDGADAETGEGGEAPDEEDEIKNTKDLLDFLQKQLLKRQ